MLFAMPRYAIGDLTIDVDVPPRFKCEYSLTGSLLGFDASTGASLELSALTLKGGTGVDAARERAKSAGLALHRDEASFVSFQEPPRTWFAGFGSHLLIATLTKGELIPEFADVLASVDPAHDTFPEGDKTSFSALRPSHTRFFEQRRNALLDAISWSPQLRDAPKRLDDFWESLVDEPPEEEGLLNTMLSAASIGFGDLLCARGFEWCVSKDAWGLSLGVVALRGTANMLVVPDSFLIKRWETQERRFIESALVSITESVARARAEWAQSKQ